MKPQLIKVSNDPTHSFSVRRDLVPYMNNKTHYHSEVELVYLKSGVGTQIVGDNIRGVVQKALYWNTVRVTNQRTAK